MACIRNLDEVLQPGYLERDDVVTITFYVTRETRGGFQAHGLEFGLVTLKRLSGRRDCV